MTQRPDPEDHDARPALAELTLGFLKIGLLGFGGVAPIARRVIVDQSRWLDEADYAALVSACQVAPGANTVNIAIMIGDRFQGLRGALACLCALMAGPLAVLTLLAFGYDRLAGVAEVRGALAGSASAAAGLIMGTALRILAGVKLTPWAWICFACAFAAVGIFRAPLPWVVATLGPLSIAGAALAGRRP